MKKYMFVSVACLSILADPLFHHSTLASNQESYTVVKSKAQLRKERHQRKIEAENFATLVSVAVESVGDAIYPEHKTKANRDYLDQVLRMFSSDDLETVVHDWESTFTPNANPSLSGLLTFAETICVLNQYKTWDKNRRNDRLQFFAVTYNLLSRIPALHSILKGVPTRASELCKFLVQSDPYKLAEFWIRRCQFQNIPYPKLHDLSPLDPIVTHFMNHSPGKALEAIQGAQGVLLTLNRDEINLVRGLVNHLQPEQYEGFSKALRMLSNYDGGKWSTLAPGLIKVLSHFPGDRIPPVAKAIMSPPSDISSYRLGCGYDNQVLMGMDRILSVSPYELKNSYIEAWADLIVQFNGLPAPGCVEAHELWGKPEWAEVFIKCSQSFFPYLNDSQHKEQFQWNHFFELTLPLRLILQRTSPQQDNHSIMQKAAQQSRDVSEEDDTTEDDSDGMDILQGRPSLEDEDHSINYSWRHDSWGIPTESW